MAIKSRKNTDVTGVEITKIAYVAPLDVRHTSRYVFASNAGTNRTRRLRNLVHASKQEMANRIVKEMEKGRKD